MKNEIFCEKLKIYRDDYIDELENLNKSLNTLNSYSSTINSFIEFLLDFHVKEVTFKNLRRSDFTKFLTYKSLTLNKHADAKASSKSLYLRHLKQFFNYIESELEEVYDFDKIFNKLKIEVPERDPKGLESEEVKKVLVYLENNIYKANVFDVKNSRSNDPYIKEKHKYLAYRNSLITKIYLYSGIRVSELIDIKIKDLYREDDLYEIKVLGKGNKVAKVFLSAQKVKNEIEYFKKNNFRYIAYSWQEKPLDRTQIWRILTNIFLKSGVKKSGVHILRHTFAKTVYAATKDIGTVKEMLRHKSINTTTIYAKESEQTTKNNYLKAIQ